VGLGSDLDEPEGHDVTDKDRVGCRKSTTDKGFMTEAGVVEFVGDRAGRGGSRPGQSDGSSEIS